MSLVDVDPVWKPLPRQQKAYDSLADELFYGGAAGGGKSDLLLGLAFYEHTRSIIFRREYVQLSGLIDRSAEIYSKHAKFNNTKKRWQHFFNPRKVIEFGACQLETDKENYQGRAHDLKAFDEITQFTETMYSFLTNWCRTSIDRQRTRCVCTGNPPTSADGEWVIKYWAPWLDPDHKDYPAEPGELRWYASGGDGISIEVPSNEIVVIKGEPIMPRSRTFIPAHVEDNPYLIATGYKARLQALPEPLRSKMLNGDFTTVGEDDPLQVIPSLWVVKAQNRWKEANGKPGHHLTHVGVDVARGGKDKTVIAYRHGNFITQLKEYDGHKTPDGLKLAALVKKDISVDTTILIDVIGVGSAGYDILKSTRKGVIPLNSSKKSKRTDKSKELHFANKRAEWWWLLREELDPDNGSDIALPPDAELKRELCTPKWSHTTKGVLVESKDDIRKRIGKSTNKADAVVYSFAKEHVNTIQTLNISHMRR